MKRLEFSIAIHAPKRRVWDTMFGEESYRAWTSEFAAGSHYVGDWNEGSKILFLAPDEKGSLSGMVSRIKESRRYDHVAIEHRGVVKDGEEDLSAEWSGALERYTFRELDGGTEVLVEMDTTPEHEEMFQDIWPKALERLKALAEEEDR